MHYIGIPNSPSKVKIAGRVPIKTILVCPVDLAWDCTRHVDFLRAVARIPHPRVMVVTDYAAYLTRTGRSPEAVIEKCYQFWALWQAIETHPPESWATVTEDGIRLDGSHRAACAVVLGLETVPVDVVPLFVLDGGFRKLCAKIRAQKGADDDQ